MPILKCKSWCRAIWRRRKETVASLSHLIPHRSGFSRCSTHLNSPFPKGSSPESIVFRFDSTRAWGALGGALFQGGYFGLSTTLRNPDGLSTVFSDNRGSDYLSVEGAFLIGGLFQPGETTQPWKQTLVGRDFYYDPSRGNLLLEVVGLGRNIFTPRSMDATTVVGDSVSWVWATDGNSLSGTAETRGLVARFDITLVPEPSVWAMLVAGISLALFFRRR